jgi:molecular chaperone DnaK (HSP70)
MKIPLVMKGIEPDEVVAYGAAILGGYLSAPLDARWCNLGF